MNERTRGDDDDWVLLSLIPRYRVLLGFTWLELEFGCVSDMNNEKETPNRNDSTAYSCLLFSEPGFALLGSIGMPFPVLRSCFTIKVTSKPNFSGLLLGLTGFNWV